MGPAAVYWPPSTARLGRQFRAIATAPMVWAAAANAYAQGADGFGLFGGGWRQDGWPWHADEYRTLRPLAHSDLLETTDKLYRAVSTPEPPSAGGLTGDGVVKQLGDFFDHGLFGPSVPRHSERAD